MRWLVLAALASAAVVSYLTRASISSAGTTIQDDLHLTDVELGYVLSGFFMGYIWLQIPGGWLGSRLGARLTLPLFCLLWSAATLASALSLSLETLRWSRIAMGAAQAGLFAVIIQALSDWFPESRRGTAGAAITGAMSIGAVIAGGLTVRLVGPLGWRGTFEVYAVIGVVWSILFVLWFRNAPEEHPAVNEAECALIRGGVKPASEAASSVLEIGADLKDRNGARNASIVSVLASMALSASMWALCAQSFFRAFGYALFITWFPAYLEQGYHVSRARAGDLSMLPLAGVTIGSFAGGPIIDLILARTGSRWLSRSGAAALALGLCAATTLAAAMMAHPMAAVGLVAIGALFSGVGGPTTWAATMDISGRHTALAFAIMNMAGNLGAIACPIVVGYLIDRIRNGGGPWHWVLDLFAAIYLAAAVSWLVLDPNRPAVRELSPNRNALS